MLLSRELRVTLVAPKSAVTGGFYRMGAALRAMHPPSGVRYTVTQRSKIVSPRYDKYEVSPVTFIYWLGTTVSDHLRTRADGDLIHAFFWDYFNPWRPWIHENDSSLSQYLSGYFGFNKKVFEKALRIGTTILNAESCRRVIAWSEHAKRGLVADGVRPEKIEVIPPPVPLSKKAEKVDDGFTMTYIGRDYRRKGGDFVLRAFREISKVYPNTRLNFLGPIDDPELKSWVASDPRISVADFMLNADIRRRVYPYTDLLLMPSRAEAFGLTVVEAMSYGIPVLVSDLPVLREIVGGNEQFYFKTNNFGEFVSKIRLLVEDESLRSQAGNALQTAVAERYSPEVVNPRLLGVYEKAL